MIIRNRLRHAVSMTGWNRLIRESRQRGQTMVLFAIAATFLIAISGLAIEGGLLEADRRFSQAVSDGAALAGAHHLPGNPAAAQQAAADYAVRGLNGGRTIASLNGCSPPATAPAPGVPLPAACDPSSTPPRTLTITTPYDGHNNEILVRLDHTNSLNLAAVVGATSANVASRSVARSSSGEEAFGYTVYAAENITQNGNADAFVNGNVYAQGCITYGNAGTFTVRKSVSQDGSVLQVGKVELYNKHDVPLSEQSWTAGNGVGCTAKVDGSGGPTQWGAFGHATGDQNCGPPAVAGAGFINAGCPSGEPPVNLMVPPEYTPYGPAGCPASPNPSPDGQSTVSPGCYNACSAGNKGDTTFPNVVFQPGTYGFVGDGSAGGCNVILSGTANGDGVTFYLYNGTSMCNNKVCGNADHNDITLSAPTNGPNFGRLVFSCGSPCGAAGSGLFDFKGPSASINLQGMIYNPGGDCIVDANAGSRIVGQLICNNIELQGGSISSGTGVTFGGGLLPIPRFTAELIE